MAKILITGANGQLGTELRHLLDERGIEYVARDAKDMDITDRQAVEEQVMSLKPEVIYHCAAYTAVDKAEEEGKEINWKVNEDGTRNLAEAAAKIGAKLVYLSTDYVFDGTKTSEYEVDDPTNPKNEYGKAKLAGEKAIQAAMNNYYIIRTSWVFGKYGKNFVYTMLRLAKDHDRLTVVDDQVGRPTWTRTLAEFMTYLVDHDCEYGVYQLSNEGSCSWYEFASEILKDKDVEVAPVTSEEYPQKAYRPRHSIMSLRKAEATGFEIIDWHEALSRFLKSIDL
ncbi:dTDP-4-dehydrorhamnose reductase [Limosilactobacillus mucosae]|uniref:dTDP-4-dehydrorhamnose reductase n=1 Tax=Limosilactobacillus mucosae TaxID=97478 RepID=UPI00233F7495|nr:dTDP-4-dehydrorhamnose reductase [Limosilactobacillus mucosae]MDC2836508.1 dTDP-4-dehydrorhamnose reductase [Limosilactobacillus mucosae]MDC2848602.1 dTDP-4-dehydrorhamnose reductase [Limosilactobacillus mucosae]MDC2852739.1 dTDP-4-dehydrorhamnose reductase [Limosilactobacillus mucosae]